MYHPIRFGKYNAKRVSHAGYSFASKLESGLFDLLKLFEASQRIKDIKVQQTIYLTEARIRYIADFSVFDLERNELVFWEAKGVETPEWRLKLKLYKVYGPAPLNIFRGHEIPIELVIPKPISTIS
jgi:hypothetical protein